MASHILSEVEKVCTHVAILKNGNLLEQGDVRTLLGGETLIEISSDELEKLDTLASECNFVNWNKKGNGHVLLSLKDGKTARDLNEYFFKKGITLTRLLSHKKTLESQFLELVKE